MMLLHSTADSILGPIVGISILLVFAYVVLVLIYREWCYWWQPAYVIYCKPNSNLDWLEWKLFFKGYKVLSTTYDAHALIVKVLNSEKHLRELREMNFVENVERLKITKST